MRHVDTLVIHHSACPTGSVAVFRAEHKAKGWLDIGYHAVIGNGRGQGDGAIAIGRPYSEVGSGVWGNNTGKLHVCLVGNFHKPDPGFTGRPTSKQLASLGFWLLVNAKRFGPDCGQPVPRIVGHREIALPGHSTACPGSEMPLDGVRKWFKKAFPLFLARAKYPALDVYLYGGSQAVVPPPSTRRVLYKDDAHPNGVLLPSARVWDGATFIPVSSLGCLGWKVEYRADLDQVWVTKGGQ